MFSRNRARAAEREAADAAKLQELQVKLDAANRLADRRHKESATWHRYFIAARDHSVELIARREQSSHEGEDEDRDPAAIGDAKFHRAPATCVWGIVSSSPATFTLFRFQRSTGCQRPLNTQRTSPHSP